MMARIRSENTRPELLSRAAVHALGFRFRNNVSSLPGKPDLANKAALSLASTRGKRISGATGHRKLGVWGDALVFVSGNRRTTIMSKPELGTKRLCARCSTKFYDLNRAPIACPKCGTVFEAVQVSSRWRTEPARATV